MPHDKDLVDGWPIAEGSKFNVIHHTKEALVGNDH